MALACNASAYACLQTTLLPMLCVGTHTYECLCTICITTQERGNEENGVRMVRMALSIIG